MNLLIKISVRAGIFFVIALYCLFCLIFLTIGNAATCERLERNYVTCQQYKTSWHLIQGAIYQKIFKSPQPKTWRISYQLKGTEIIGNQLYLQTSEQPILYIANIDGWAIEYPIKEVKQFIKGQGYAKKTIYLENSPLSLALYSTLCLVLGILIIGTTYHLDKRLVNQLFQS